MGPGDGAFMAGRNAAFHTVAAICVLVCRIAPRANLAYDCTIDSGSRFCQPLVPEHL
jgi:hypothetical protein